MGDESHYEMCYLKCENSVSKGRSQPTRSWSLQFKVYVVLLESAMIVLNRRSSSKHERFSWRRFEKLSCNFEILSENGKGSKTIPTKYL